MNEPELPESMPEKPQTSWRKFSRISVDKRAFKRRVKKAETSTTKHAHRFIIDRVESLHRSRERILAWFVVVGAIMVAILGQVVLDEKQDVVQASAVGGTYAEGMTGGIASLNPLYASTSAEVAASKLIFSSLYRYDETGALTPDLASSLSVSPNANSYLLKMKENLVWHDGEPLDADDVIFTLNLAKNPETRADLALQNNWRDVDVKKVDNLTVRFVLPAYASFPHALTFAVLPEHLLSSVAPGALAENSFSQSPVGSGPFEFRILQNAEATTGERVVHMTANENYHLGKPKVSRFELHAYTTEEKLAAALRGDALTAAVTTRGDDIDPASVDRGYERRAYPINNGVYAMMNTTTGVFSDKAVRQAVRLAIDTEALRSAVTDDVRPLWLPFLASQMTDDTKLPAEPKQDLAKAQDVLRKARWKKVSGTWEKGKQKLSFSITTPKNTQYERAANEIARQLRETGMQVTVTVVDDSVSSSSFIGDILQRRNFEMLVYELQIGADPDVYAYWHSSQVGNSGYNFTSYRNATADAALVSARDRSDEKLRSAKYAAFARQWIADVPAIGLYRQTMVYFQKPGAHTMDDDAELVATSDRYAFVRDWTVNRRDVYKTP